jgi:hypothetical protein
VIAPGRQSGSVGAVAQAETTKTEITTTSNLMIILLIQPFILSNMAKLWLICYKGHVEISAFGHG